MYLGLDCGTSGLKALLVDAGGATIANAARAYLPDRPKPGWSEQDPDVWRAAMAGAIADLRTSAPAAVAAVKAVGFSGQMHGTVLVDDAGAAGPPGDPAQRRPGARGSGRTRARDPDLAGVVGVKPMPGFTGPKLLWLARHEPDIRDRIAACSRQKTTCASRSPASGRPT